MQNKPILETWEEAKTVHQSPTLQHCDLLQHLLWIGSDPLRTLRFCDSFGSNVAAGEGAIPRGTFKSSCFRILDVVKARSKLLKPETLSIWIDKNPIQTTVRMISLFIEVPISCSQETGFARIGDLSVANASFVSYVLWD